ncbi:membrane-associated protein, putative [Bodo saltans]|uniref:Membrane-associated protein, putative n=1 Tax=Bodo saltans TaxID=75058 RepID=A0A0S4JJA7_BODSA|nr:membrane-associated protein, putative [Bodo saltans]|eukprot:CUG90241.1 membrane-associated protein, putative [Bodo saltans]
MMRLTCMSALLLVAALLLAVLGTPTSVDANLCKVGKSNSAWKHGGGIFRRKGPKSIEWTEYDNDGKAGSDFVEETREGDQLVITNQVRGISILLRHDLAGIRNRGEQQFQQLYQGGWMKVADCTKDAKGAKEEKNE